MQINHPAYLTGVERSGIGKDEDFCADYVTMVRTASNKLTRDMVNMSKCGVAHLKSLPEFRIVEISRRNN